MSKDRGREAHQGPGEEAGGTPETVELRARFQAAGRAGLVRDRAAEARRTRLLYAVLQAVFAVVFLVAIGTRLSKGTDPGLWLAAYAIGAAGCGLAVLVSLRGRTRPALVIFFVTAVIGGLGDSLVSVS
ncbi:hypothetical protein [Streptomyces sp. NPDC050738]|uniref:hypothetical protein n=1 Tax=Streptomyces sp. NPDC050738 TaxID=3154744 RepID=UPI003444962B